MGILSYHYMKLHVIVTAFNRPTDLKRLIFDFILQTNKEWGIRIIHDGEPPVGIVSFIYSLKDKRISFSNTASVNGFWGHPNRRLLLEQTKGAPDDYVLITNDDNQYVKSFWEIMRRQCKPDTGMIFCNTIHNYFDYEILNTEIKVGHIDMGSFIVRLDVAQKVGFNHTAEVADGFYAEECAAECKSRKLKIVPVKKALFIHN